MALRVAFDATAAVRQTAGIGRYTRELLSALASESEDIEYRTFAFARGADGYRDVLRSAKIHVRSVPLSDRVMNAVWYRCHVPLPVQLFAGTFDLYHSPDFSLPPLLRNPGVLTIHDLAFLTVPDAAYPTLRTYLERVVPASAHRAAHVIAVSENTRKDVIQLLNISPERVTTISEGVSSQFAPRVDLDRAWDRLRQEGIREPFILSVGTLEPRKNYVRLLEAYALLRRRGVEHMLVIAGRPGWLYQPILQRLDELELKEYVRFLQPSDSLLVDLYGLCAAFIYPSLYEGFGIPPLEALACGAPVACSSASCLPEVVGSDALLFDPHNTEEMAAALERLLSSADLARDLRQRGPRRAAQFTWQKAARETVALYREVAGAA